MPLHPFSPSLFPPVGVQEAIFTDAKVTEANMVAVKTLVNISDTYPRVRGIPAKQSWSVVAETLLVLSTEWRHLQYSWSSSLCFAVA